MNAATKLLLILALVGGAGFGIYLTFSSDDTPPPIFVPEDEPADNPEEKPIAPVKTAIKTPAVSDRKQVDTRISAAEDSAQGVNGRVIDSSGAPIGDVDVYLVEGHGKNIFQAMMLAQKGVIYPPVAQTVTNDHGLFELGLQRHDPEKTYELRFVGSRHSDKTLPGITIFKEKWYDAKDVVMDLGLAVHGRITVQGNALLPIAGATVSIKTNANVPILSPTPGREDGITAITDEQGYYRIENVAAGIATVAAVAEQYARVERQNTQITAGGQHEINFELPKGRMITGVVTDADGNPISGAKINAIAISSKTTMAIDTRSEKDGAFKLIGLVDGPFQLNVNAQEYVGRQIKPVMAGTMDQVVVLEQQGSALLRVISKSNKLIKNYTFMIKTYHEGQEHYGNVQGGQVTRVRSSDLKDGAYPVSGLNPGAYVFEVYAKKYAKTYSQNFTITLGAQEPLIVVEMLAGGKLEGIVLSSDGTPLSGVTVRTMPNFLDENPFTTMFSPLIPFKITKQQVKTNSQGRYRLNTLAPGVYQLKFTHPAYSDVYLKEQTCEEGQLMKIGNVTMDRGTIVSGTVLVDNVPTAQVKVTISAVNTPGIPGATVSPFSSDAITDNEGRFTIRRRLPPGSYEARAARQTVGNPILQVVDFAKTQQKFQVQRGQETYELHFTMQGDNK